MFQKNISIIIALCLLVSFILTACNQQNSAPASQSASQAPSVSEAQPESQAAEESTDSNRSAVFNKVCEGPFLVTSVGQSADAAMVEAMLKKLGADFTFNAAATADDVAAAGTVIVAAGASSKGLGAAGISVEQELARADEMLNAAKENGAVIIAMHIGGSARRGELSDQFSDKVFAYADYIIMVEDGDQDGKYSTFAQENNIPLTFVKSAAEATNPLKDALGL